MSDETTRPCGVCGAPTRLAKRCADVVGYDDDGVPILGTEYYMPTYVDELATLRLQRDALLEAIRIVLDSNPYPESYENRVLQAAVNLCDSKEQDA